MLPSPYGSGLGFWGFRFSRPYLRSLSLRPDDSLTILKMALSIGCGDSVSLHSAIQATRLLTVTSVGLPPTEHTSFSWTRFRTAGFPRYGFKVGLPNEACPADWLAIVLRALCVHRNALLCVRDDALTSTSVRADRPLYPRGPRSGPGCFVPVHPRYPAPSAPLAGTSRLHRLAAYTRCLRCADSRMPRRPTTGSELSLILNNARR